MSAMIAAAVWSNVLVGKMAKLVQVDWQIKNDRAAKETIRKYRQKYGNGPLFRKFLVACGVAGVAGMLFIFGRFIS